MAYPFFISRRLLLHGNLGDAAAMTTSLEVGFKKSLHNLDCLLIANEATGHCEHVGIIVHTRKACNFGNPAECRANALVLIERHIDTLTTATDAYTGIALTALHGKGARMGKVGIVTTVGAMSAEVAHGDSLTLEILNHCNFGFVAGMVAAKCHRLVLFDYHIPVISVISSKAAQCDFAGITYV